MRRRTKNMLMGLGTAFAGTVAITTAIHFITKKLVKVALERDGAKNFTQSKTMRRQITGLKNAEHFFELLNQGEEKLRGYETERIEIESYDGLKLVGHFFSCENPKRVIVAMHGWRSNWAKDFGTIADSWHDKGCNILFAEQRGQGESEGTYMGFGMMERYDCLEWIKWIHATKGESLPVYLAGVSMGATTVLMASNLELPGNVRGIIADCGFTSAHDIWRHVVRNNLHLAYGVIGRIADDMCKKRIRLSTKDFSTLEAMKENKIPVLFIHGTDDHFVPIGMTYENYKACKAPKRLLVVPGADHGMSYYTNKEEYDKAIETFWQDFDFC